MSAAALDVALHGARSALLDTSTLLAFHTAHELVHPLARHLLGRIVDDQDPLHGMYSAVSVMECLVRPIQAGPQAATVMVAFLTAWPNLNLIGIDFEVGQQAATLRATTSLSGVDALVVATGLVQHADAIISNDDRWAKQLAHRYPALRWVYLDAFR